MDRIRKTIRSAVPDDGIAEREVDYVENCHYAKATLDPDTNAVTFGTPVAIPGAVNLSLDPEGDTEPFYADDMVYYTTVANNGYSGDLEIALIPESFRKDILKETEDANGVLAGDHGDSASERACKGEDRREYFRRGLQRMVFQCLSDGERSGVGGSYRYNDRKPSAYACF